LTLTGDAASASAPPSAQGEPTVPPSRLSRYDAQGQIGTTTASGAGLWTFSYTGTTLSEGSYGFTGTATVNGKISPESPPFQVTVDKTAPTVTLTAPATTMALKPHLQVTATDLVGLAATTTVTLDVDTNNDGNFTGEAQTQVDERGDVTSFVNDVLGRVVQTIDAAKGVASAIYDAVSNLLGQVDQRGDHQHHLRQPRRPRASPGCRRQPGDHRLRQGRQRHRPGRCQWQPHDLPV
jgi:hypothetical protein